MRPRSQVLVAAAGNAGHSLPDETRSSGHHSHRIHDTQKNIEHYILAREFQAQDLTDQILEIADDTSGDWVEKIGADGKAVMVVQGKFDPTPFLAGTTPQHHTAGRVRIRVRNDYITPALRGAVFCVRHLLANPDLTRARAPACRCAR
jgi:hypothetical protein